MSGSAPTHRGDWHAHFQWLEQKWHPSAKKYRQRHVAILKDDGFVTELEARPRTNHEQPQLEVQKPDCIAVVDETAQPRGDA